jgi:hypothetical protein
LGLPIDIVRKDRDYQITMTQGSFSLNPPFEPSIVGNIVQALGLQTEDLDENVLCKLPLPVTLK